MLPGIQRHAALQAVAHLALAQREAAAALDATVRKATDLGASYTDLAQLLGVTRQAVRQRYGK